MTPGSTGLMDRPTGSIPTRHLSTQGRDGEQESNVRSVCKKQAIRRYEQEFTNLKKGSFNPDE